MDVGSGRLLLLDLDGVVVLESGPPLCETLQILVLHEQLVAQLARLGMPTYVLTHRSRSEALRILEAAGVPESGLAGVFAAEDIFFSAIRHGLAFTVLRHGLRKSLILPELKRRSGIGRSRTILIDDRKDNVQDMLDSGVGLVLHAPSEIAADGRSFVTFDFEEAVQAITGWTAETPTVITQRGLRLEPGHVRHSGMNTRAQARHVFNIVRPMRRHLGSWLAETGKSIRLRFRR